jgi:hypothetical protein
MVQRRTENDSRPLARARRRRKVVSRPAIILPCVLAALVVVMLVAAALTEAIVLDRRQGRRCEERQQALWLAESALQRAVHAAAKSPDYRGETWRVPAEVLGGRRPGVAIIRVEPVAAPRPGRRVQVEAYYPEETVDRTLYQREAFVNSPSPGGKP